MAALRREPVLRVSAPGKVILFGEHSVVYDRLAIAVSVGLRTHLNMYPTDGEVILDLPDIGLRRRWRVDELRAWFGGLVENDWRNPLPASEELRQRLRETICRHEPDISSQHALALVSFFYLYCSLCPGFPSVHVEVRSELPTGAGLGSSAAYSVCLATALLYRYHQVAPSEFERLTLHTGEEVRPDEDMRELISNWAFTSDKIFHGKASGIDNAVSAHGGALAFKAGEMDPLQDTQMIQILLVDTRVPRSTYALVQHVRNQHDDEQFSAVVKPILDAMDALAGKALNALTIGDEPTLKRLVKMNQGLLSALGVSHPALDNICLAAARHDLVAKLTGAGGGGFALVLITSDTPDKKTVQMKEELEKLGYGVYRVEVGGDGVLVQNLTV